MTALTLGTPNARKFWTNWEGILGNSHFCYKKTSTKLETKSAQHRSKIEIANFDQKSETGDRFEKL